MTVGVAMMRRSSLSLAVAVIAAGMQAPAQAVEISNGEVHGSFDTTLSYGLSYRVEDRDQSIIGIANGGTAFSVNSDDGNLNYDKGLFSNIFKVTSELDLNYRNFGAFVRGTAFYDFENENGSREKQSLTTEAKERVAKDLRLLDAYVTGRFELGDMPTEIRVGDQVVSWGESTFIQNSINSINPIDVSAIRVPGAELREALIPEGMVWASVSPTENSSVEGFVLYDWKETIADPSGTYFSTNDFATDGGFRAMLGFGDLPESDFLGIPRDPTIKADDRGQYGVSLRLYVPQMNDTEFGFYYMNYHSRLPLISARTGTLLGAATAAAIGDADVGDGGAADIIGGTLLSGGNPAAGAALAGPLVPADAAAAIAGATAATFAATGDVAAAQAAGTATATAFATDAYVDTTGYFTEYPEDIELFGISFNTELQGSGVALQGEVSHRKDAPLQVDDIELLFAALGVISPSLAAFNQVGDFTGQFDTVIPGFIERDVTQAQATMTKVFSQVFGADQFAVVGEVAYTHIHDMPDKDVLRLNGPGTSISGNEILASAHGPSSAGQFEAAEHFADENSWGYRLAGRLDYNNAIGAVKLSPRLAWQHDVSGITPGPGGNFLEGRKAVTLGLGGSYLSDWSADLSYTRYFGAGRYNLINDRDFIAANIKYSF